MNYYGPLYGKVGRRQIPLSMTSADVDRIERQLDEARELAAQDSESPTKQNG